MTEEPILITRIAFPESNAVIMQKATFPFLTVEMLETNSTSLLQWLGTFWPEAQPEIVIIRLLLPELNKVSFVKAALQYALDKVNGITGAQPPAVTV